MRKRIAVLMGVVSAICCASAYSDVVQTEVNPSNGHTYHMLSASNWPDAEAEAIRLRGHLATINNADEDLWVWETFNNGTGWDIERLLWIGLNDMAEEGVYVWSSGEPVTYTNWAPNQPSDTGLDGRQTDWVQQGYIGYDPEYAWNNLFDTPEWTGMPLQGVVEVSVSPPLTWDNKNGDGDSNWGTAANWVPNQLPDEFNETTIANGDTVLLDSAAQQAWSVSLENGTLHIAAGGELSVTDGIIVAADCTLTGGGVVTTSAPIVVEWGGTIAPGDGVGTLSVSSIALQSGSALSVELGGPGLGDRLDLAGELNLAARGDTLSLTWIPGGDSSSKFGGDYAVVSYESSSGTFETVGGGSEPYSIGEAYIAGIDYETDNQVTLSLHTLLDADADLDGDVDFGDYMILEAWFGGPGDWSKGDFDFDGDIDFGDYMILEAAFGDSVPAGAVAVPEPGTLVMLLGSLAGLAVLGWRRRRA